MTLAEQPLFAVSPVQRSPAYPTTLSTLLRRTALPLLAGAGIAAFAPLRAQTIAVNASSSASTVILPGARLTVPVVIDLTNSGATTIASLASAISWNASRLRFDSLRVVGALGWSFTPNIAAAATGSVGFTASNATALGTSATLANAYFTATATTGGTVVTLAPSAAANASAASVLSAVLPRSLDVCVAPSGLLGDVNNSASVNIIDAQQIARFSVGLAVVDANAVARRGDVRVDNAVNIIDAQQVARFSVGLATPASPLLGTSMFVPPVIASAALTPSATQNLLVGGSVQLVATALDAGSADISGCSSFTWSSSNAAAATVNTSGFVSAIGAGNATITATSVSNPLVTASVSVAVSVGVGAPTIHVTIAHAGRPARQYLAQVTGGSIVGFQGVSLTGSNMNGGTMDIVVPTAGSYTVRVAAIDAASPTNALFLVGGQFSLAVPSAGTVNASLTLTAATYTKTSTNTAAVGAAIPIAWSIVDPSGLIDASGRGAFCGGVQSSLTTLTSDFDGTNSSACTVTHPSVGTPAFSGTITSQPSPGRMNVLLYGVQKVIDGATDDFVYWLNPSITRSETPYLITIAPIATVAVTPTGSTVAVGGVQQMVATARDSVNAVVTGWPVTWQSSLPSVATISAGGVVTGVANGSTTITATANGISGTTSVSVSGGLNVGSIAVALGASTLSGNAATTATQTVRDPQNNIIPAAVTWSSSQPFVARVAADGTVQALGTGTSTITATIGAVTGSATLTVNAIAPSYNIVIRTVGSVPLAVQTALNTAAARWSQVIRGDEPNVTATNLDISGCIAGVAPLNEIIDDLIIYVEVAAIDGAGNTQAQAGPCAVRAGTGHAYVGTLTIDQADVATMQSNGTLDPVVLHEMGHVLGIGTNWTTNGLLANPAPSFPDPAGDPTFLGVNAQWAFQFMGTGYGGAIVPVENCCGAGTRNSHWRETVLQRELMTGFVNGAGGINPLSPLTAASLVDLGYVVDLSQADGAPYFLMAPGVRASISFGGIRIPIIELPKPAPMVTDLRGHIVGAGARRAPVLQVVPARDVTSP